MGTRLKADVDGRLREQRLIGRGHTAESIDLGMTFAGTDVVAFAQDAPALLVGIDDDCAHHGVGRGGETAVACQLEAALHPVFVGDVHVSVGREIIERCGGDSEGWGSALLHTFRLGQQV